ncbi:response regulator transcription factor [Rossellomorea marisflavi]|uniref:response regulator transcription factor n=1 Tax=Rossellomorea marisflavi TaxID=189381 RepID=UPI003F532BF7
MNGKDTLLKVQAEEFDLILLDVMLPDMNGFEVCREIRKYSEAPIIFISSCSSDFDKLTGLGAGGDDYITKPFNPLEVVARVKAIFRRKKMYEARSIPKSIQTNLTYGNILLTPSEARLVVEEREVKCTAKKWICSRFFFSTRIKCFRAGNCMSAFGVKMYLVRKRLSPSIYPESERRLVTTLGIHSLLLI